ncbi:hypothetical protein HPB50_015012 [Hyalomma asiaticum]|uniref:Uncharacterized protein n=1 Tax=Hyalomma asiaticum TaxID=266040 RepID=A0ACB7T7K6_HYAAI|nr:hypothetical protein HPB50_015012 [Hyalomma asiaticum]
MSKRRRVLKAEESSMLLLQQLEHMETSSSDDDDCHIYASKFAELFAEPLDVPKVQDYVRKVVSSYSDKQFRSNFRLPRSACNELIRQFEASDFYPSDRSHGDIAELATALDDVIPRCAARCVVYAAASRVGCAVALQALLRDPLMYSVGTLRLSLRLRANPHLLTLSQRTGATNRIHH